MLHVVYMQTDCRCARLQELIQECGGPGSPQHHPDSGLLRVSLPHISPDGRGSGPGSTSAGGCRLSHRSHSQTMVKSGPDTGLVTCIEFIT